MRNIVSSILIISLAGVASANESFLRDLQVAPRTRKGPAKYGENVTIEFKASLGCGACVRGGFVYCIPGAEGSDPESWGVGKKSVCCKDATCPQVKDTANFNCSSSYSDPIMAKSVCPFVKRSCGNNTAFNFDSVGQKQNINITLARGETCTYQIQAECGLPAFKPNDTEGFDIENVDYDDDDLDAAGTQLQQLPAGNSTNQTVPQQGPRRNFGSDKKPPKPPKRVVPVRQDKKHKAHSANETDHDHDHDDDEVLKKKGPKASRFDPEERKGQSQKFKGGKRNGNENICKKRYQQVSITALGEVNSTSARILQTDSDVFTMTLEIGTEDFSGAVMKMIGLTFMVAVSAVSLIF